MMPVTGGTGGGMPADTAAELTSAGREAAAMMPAEPSVKAASLGGGGGGGVPSMPLAPATGIDAESVRPAAAGDLGALGQGKAAAGSALAAAAWECRWGPRPGHGGAKSKGAQQEEEALYTEDRAWTEAVIGNRRRQDSKESK